MSFESDTRLADFSAHMHYTTKQIGLLLEGSRALKRLTTCENARNYFSRVNKMSLEKDIPRVPCRYGAKCYQKNSHHLSKYAHPPRSGETVEGKITDETTTGIKRGDIFNDNGKRKRSESPQRNLQKKHESSKRTIHYDTGTKVLGVNEQAGQVSSSECYGSEDPTKCNTVEKTSMPYDFDSEKIIKDLFLVEMPKDFFQFYDFCKSISKNDPLLVCKSAGLELVGPYDILSGKIKNLGSECDKEKYLIHWRYYYDPPEFQTIIKCHNKEGLHFGYWRDDVTEKPVFVAKNCGNVNCIFESVAENVFGVVDNYLQNKIKLANPFEKTSITRLHSQLKNFAKQYNITLEKNTADMRTRERNVVARTFHKAGIVVPYDKKTQLGYRDLAATDDDLQKILKQIEEANTADERKVPIIKLDEIIRLSTIAADECDFGTCLELGHDLFSNGSIHVQNRALQMLSIAYTHLQRPQLLKILEAHLKNRKRGCELSII